MELTTIQLETDGPLGRLTLNRPDRLNALGATLLQELVEAARWFDAQPGVRVVIVRGAGRAFSAGADLKDPSTADADPAAGLSWSARREVGQRGYRMVQAVEGMRAVTVAQVHGHAVGGAVLLMVACDLRVAARDTVFSIPEVDLGIPLAWGGIPRLVREIGPARTKELVMTCRPFTPVEAHAAGLVNRVVAPEELARETEELALELASKPQVPVLLTKEHVNAVSRAQAAGDTSYADGDVLLGTLADPASQEARRTYVGQRLGGRR